MRPTSRLAPERIVRAPELAAYPSSWAARRTLVLVSGLMCGWSLRARETVEWAMPSEAAMSLIVTSPDLREAAMQLFPNRGAWLHTCAAITRITEIGGPESVAPNCRFALLFSHIKHHKYAALQDRLQIGSGIT